MLHDAIQINFPTVIGSILMLLFILLDRSFSRKTSRLFACAAVAVLCLVLIDNKALFMADPQSVTFFRRLMTALGYALRPVLALIITIIFLRRETAGFHLALVPVVLNAGLSLASIFTGWVFSYAPSGAFVRGPLGFLPFAVSGFYILLMVVVCLRRFGGTLHSENLVVLIIGALCITGTVMDAALGYSGMLNAACSLGVTFYYLYFHVRVYSRDPLTHAFNRRIFYLDGENAGKKAQWVVSIDLNNLKAINDASGHAAGDKALVALTDAIRMHLQKGCTLYRMGGDEFALLCGDMEEADMAAMIGAVRCALSGTSYSFACGYARRPASRDLEAAYREADARMYADKKQSKTQGILAG